MKVGVGGTFNRFHRGHRVLIDKAFALGDHVVLGVSSDSFTALTKDVEVPLEDRLVPIRGFLSTKRGKWEIEVLEDPMGSAATDPEMEALVVSPRTLDAGKRINAVREERGLRPLRLEPIPYILAQDCFPISSTRIMQGEVDEEGKMLRPIIVGVGSNNPVKARAVRRVMRTLYGDPIIVPMKVKNSVGDQPWGDDTLKGAVERAKASIGSMDFGVGIEAGIFQREDGLYDIQYCAVVDKMGRVTIGQGSGFRLPAVAEERIRKGESVGRVFDDLLGTRDIGRKRGVIHLLTSGALTRQKLTEQSVMAAMVPRIRYDLYLEV